MTLRLYCASGSTCDASRAGPRRNGRPIQAFSCQKCQWKICVPCGKEIWETEPNPRVGGLSFYPIRDLSTTTSNGKTPGYEASGDCTNTGVVGHLDNPQHLERQADHEVRDMQNSRWIPESSGKVPMAAPQNQHGSSSTQWRQPKDNGYHNGKRSNIPRKPYAQQWSDTVQLGGTLRMTKCVST